MSEKYNDGRDAMVAINEQMISDANEDLTKLMSFHDRTEFTEESTSILEVTFKDKKGETTFSNLESHTLIMLIHLIKSRLEFKISYAKDGLNRIKEWDKISYQSGLDIKKMAEDKKKKHTE